MRYFIVTVDKNYVAPSPLGWQGILDKKSLHDKKASQMPKHLLFQVESHMQMVDTDIITFPCFMVSEMVMSVIKKYDPFIKYARIVLFDKMEKKSMTYYLPFLNEMKGLYDMQSKTMILEKSELEEKIIGEVKDDKDKLYIIMRMDLVESILRRNAVGIGLVEIAVK